MKKLFFLFALILIGTIGCTTTQKSTATGSVIGATAGGIIGHQSGKGGVGAAIGAAAGALGGYIVGEKIAVKKFCPEGGEVYDEHYEFCPVHGVELKVQQK